MRLAPFVLASLSLSAPALAGHVLVVGPAPGQLHDLQDTIIQGQDGDIVLVKQGVYESVRAVGRSVTIIAENGANVQIIGSVRVVGLPASKTVVVSGFNNVAPPATTLNELYAGLYARDCAGQIVVQDSVLWSQAWSTTQVSYSGVHVRNCAGVAAVRTDARSFKPQDTIGLAGFHVDGSKVSIDSSLGWGGPGALGIQQNNGDGCRGGTGLYVQTSPAPSTVFASDSTFIGGSGGQGILTWVGQTICGYGGVGGPGIHGVTLDPALKIVGVNAVPGAGGTDCSGYPSNSGAPIFNGNGYWCGYWPNPNPVNAPFLGTLPGTPRIVTGTTLVRDDAQASLTFRGQPGERVEIAMSRKGASFEMQTANSGVLHVPNPVWQRLPGAVPLSGTLQRSFRMPDLPLNDPGETFVVQARFVDPSTGQVRLSNPHVVVEVDKTY